MFFTTCPAPHRPVLEIGIHTTTSCYLLIVRKGTSLVVWWIRICRPVQGTTVWSLLWEDSTCCEATKPRHNYWACALETTKHNCWACVLKLKRPLTALKSIPTCRNLRKPTGSNKDPAQVKKNKKKNEWINFKKLSKKERINTRLTFIILKCKSRQNTGDRSLSQVAIIQVSVCAPTSQN